jgi:N-acetylmuramoyl-L-alanine amidase
MRILATAFLLLAALAGAPSLAQSELARVEAVRFGAGPDRTRVVVDSSRPLQHSIFTLAEDGARVVIDLEPVAFDLDGRAVAGGQRQAEGAGLVAAYRYADTSDSGSRIVLDLAQPAAIVSSFPLDPAPGSDRYRLVIDLAPTTREAFEAAARASGGAAAPTAAAPTRTAEASPPPALAAADEPLVVVLDPGHGGNQPGATGVTGLVEKTVTLAIARAVRDRLEASGRYKVVMTRSDDRRVELEERVRIAREAGADLFLSIHSDSMASGASVRGASVYTLADYAEGRTRTEILRDDPYILDVDLSDRPAEVGSILVDLVQRDTKNQSSAFAEALIPHLREAGPLLRNTHRSKGFYVLLAPDVPAVLLEAGFLSNRQDEALLASDDHRQKLADAIAAGIDDYFDQRERLYAAR